MEFSNIKIIFFQSNEDNSSDEEDHSHEEDSSVEEYHNDEEDSSSEDGRTDGEEDCNDKQDSSGEEGRPNEEETEIDNNKEDLVESEEKADEESNFYPYIGMNIKKRFGDTIFHGKVKSGPTCVKDKKGKVISAWEVLYDDNDREEMNIKELFKYHCDDDLIKDSNCDGESLCDVFFDDGDFGLMNAKQLKKQHEKWGINFDNRWGHKKLAENLKKYRKELKIKK